MLVLICTILEIRSVNRISFLLFFLGIGQILIDLFYDFLLTVEEPSWKLTTSIGIENLPGKRRKMIVNILMKKVF